jgi:rubrerythrin
MATGETGFNDVVFDLVSVQYHALKAGHDYGQYVRDARNAGRDDIASFFEQVMAQDSERGQKCHDFLKEITSQDHAPGPMDRARSHMVQPTDSSRPGRGPSS